MRRVEYAKLLALPLIGLALVSHHTFSEESPLDVGAEFAGYALLVAAALGRLWAAAFISGHKNASLVTDGPYAITRNPLYFFSLLGFVGAGLAFESLTLAAAFGLLFFLTHWPIILREEARLSKLFGASFGEYARDVPRFLPDPRRLRRAPALVSICPTMFGRALVESSLVLSVFFLAEFVERVHREHPETVLFLIP